MSEDLKPLVMGLYERVTQLYVRFEALRSLVQQRGLLTPEQFDEKAQELEQRWKAACEAEAEADTLESLRLLLESHEGTKH